jgi:chromosome segregation protein
MDTLKANLLEAVNQKQLAEANLANARNHLAEQEQALQAQERLRMQHEQQLHPMRDALEQSRLKEQEARLHFEQCMAGLQENGLPEQALAEGLSEQAKTSELANKTMRLQREIEALGAVNLAAIQELATEKERKVYLDSQMTDLLQASETLEDAIRKIDKETRGKLQATYDEANRNFNELFNVLFGGGQAKLELLGDEILDTGIQVFAQPPGKKNTTIQLLSGGEKALTAMALVFALFRLNPAPFCLMDEVDAPLDDSNTERFCSLVKKMSERTQFLFVSHNKITMEMAQQLIGVTMQESGVSRIVDVDIDAAMRMQAA